MKQFHSHPSISSASSFQLLKQKRSKIMKMNPISVTIYTVVLRPLAFAISLTPKVTVNFTAIITKEIFLGHDFCQSWEIWAYEQYNHTQTYKDLRRSPPFSLDWLIANRNLSERGLCTPSHSNFRFSFWWYLCALHSKHMLSQVLSKHKIIASNVKQVYQNECYVAENVRKQNAVINNYFQL